MELVQIELPAPVARRGITEAQWRTLANNLYPGAKHESVLMVWDYCVARRLDPLKKPCHIVPMRVKVGGDYEWRDVVMPGIYEYRTTAQRTGDYLGHAKPEYGEMVKCAAVDAPEWCDFTVYRWSAVAQMRVEFPVRVYFREVVAVKDGKANQRWSQAPIQMLTKCAEAAALRAAFPDELGGEPTAEEMDGQRASDLVTEAKVVSTKPEKPEGYDEWVKGLFATADEGWTRLEAVFGDSAIERRKFMTEQDKATWETLKQRASAAPADEAVARA